MLLVGPDAQGLGASMHSGVSGAYGFPWHRCSSLDFPLEGSASDVLIARYAKGCHESVTQILISVYRFRKSRKNVF